MLFRSLVSTAFATWWLVPRLAEFRALYPSVDLRLETLDKDVDIAAEATSLAIRRGHGEWPGYASARLTPERITAVASPAFLSSHGPVRDLRHLLSWPLIHLDEPHRFIDQDTGRLTSGILQDGATKRVRRGAVDTGQP